MEGINIIVKVFFEEKGNRAVQAGKTFYRLHKDHLESMDSGSKVQDTFRNIFSV
jgi:hypothetical protein